MNFFKVTRKDVIFSVAMHRTKQREVKVERTEFLSMTI